MLTTTSSVYPAGPISHNLSSEEPNCFHWYSMKPFTAHFMNCSYWRVKDAVLVFCAVWLHVAFNSVMTTEQTCDQLCRFCPGMNGYGYRFTSCGWTNSCHHGCLCFLSWKHMEASSLRNEPRWISASPLTKMPSYWLLPLDLSAIIEPWSGGISSPSRIANFWHLAQHLAICYETYGSLQFNTFSRLWEKAALSFGERANERSQGSSSWTGASPWARHWGATCRRRRSG